MTKYKDNAAEKLGQDRWSGTCEEEGIQGSFVAYDDLDWHVLWQRDIGQKPPLDALPEGYIAVAYFLSPQDTPGATIRFDGEAHLSARKGKSVVEIDFALAAPDHRVKCDGRPGYAIKLIPETDLAISLNCKKGLDAPTRTRAPSKAKNRAPGM